MGTTDIRRSARFVLAVAALGAAPLAQADIVPVTWDAAGRFAHELRVPAGKFVEMCDKLAAGSTVQWAFDATAPVNFNVHYHVGKQVNFPAKSDQVAKGEGVLDVASEQDYCWMWTNKAASDASLKVRLQR